LEFKNTKIHNISQNLPIFNILNIYTKTKCVIIISKIIIANFTKFILNPKYNSVAIILKKLRNRSAILAAILKVTKKLNKLANYFNYNYNITLKWVKQLFKTY